MKKASHSNSFRTLVINSHGKTKATSNSDQKTSVDLTTTEKREKSSGIQ